jgi:hypothetical protein
MPAVVEHAVEADVHRAFDMAAWHVRRWLAAEIAAGAPIAPAVVAAAAAGAPHSIVELADALAVPMWPAALAHDAAARWVLVVRPRAPRAALVVEPPAAAAAAYMLVLARADVPPTCRRADADAWPDVAVCVAAGVLHVFVGALRYRARAPRVVAEVVRAAAADPRRPCLNFNIDYSILRQHACCDMRPAGAASL